MALVGIVLLSMAWTYIINTPNKVMFGGRELTAEQLFSAIGTEAGELEQCMGRARVQSERVPAYGMELALLHGDGLLVGDRDRRSCEPELPQAVPFGPTLDLSDIRPDPIRLVASPTPRGLKISTGRSIIAGEKDATAEPTSDPDGERDLGWVRVAAHFDCELLRRDMLAAGYPPYAAHVYLAGVQAQRQELLADGGYSPWEDVNNPGSKRLAAIPTPVFDEQKGRLLNRDKLDAAYTELKFSAEEIMRPGLGRILAGDTPPGAAESDTNSELATFWLNDCTATSGKFYRYRLRICMWNRFVGQAWMLADADDARQAVVPGQWSEPSETIRAAPQTHYFVLGSGMDGESASVEVWRWYHGQWLRKTFAVGIGESIGSPRSTKVAATPEDKPIREIVDFSTGVTLLDLRKETLHLHREKPEGERLSPTKMPAQVAVCLDTVSGQICERDTGSDRRNPTRLRLRGD